MRVKKSLGQNFLTSEAAVYKIVQAAEIKKDEMVLEVGPGKGVLTQALLDTGAHVIAIEKDRELVPELKEKFASEIDRKKLNIIEADILESKPETLGLVKGEYKIVANIPYYITGQFLRDFLSTDTQPSLMVLLLQKEVVERIIAADKKESILSVSVKVYGTPKKVTVVNRGSFFPAPNVDSAVIAIQNISKDFFADISEEIFFKVVKAGFAHKRKVLASNLTSISSKEKIKAVFEKNNIDPKIRAEDLSLNQWKIVSEILT